MHVSFLPRRVTQLSALIALVAALSAGAANAQEEEASPQDAPVDQSQAPIMAVPDEVQPEEAPPEAFDTSENPALLDGHVREGAFLAGPGSLTFILHHTLMGAAAGLVTQGISTNFNLALEGRERMLAGTLIGAGLGFGISAWWQFNNWIGLPMANYGIVNSIASGLLLVGLMDLLSDNPEVLAWTAFVGMEIGAWLTTTIGGGDMPVNHGLLIASGGLWGAVYSALFVGLLSSSGSKLSGENVFDLMAIFTGVGAGAMALATAKYDPTTAQILRADLFGLGVGGAVFLLSSLVLGFKFDIPTPYVLAMVSSAGAITAVSLLWEEAAEKPGDKIVGSNFFYRSKEKDRPYSTVWW